MKEDAGGSHHAAAAVALPLPAPPLLPALPLPLLLPLPPCNKQALYSHRTFRLQQSSTPHLLPTTCTASCVALLAGSLHEEKQRSRHCLTFHGDANNAKSKGFGERSLSVTRLEGPRPGDDWGQSDSQYLYHHVPLSSCSGPSTFQSSPMGGRRPPGCCQTSPAAFPRSPVPAPLAPLPVKNGEARRQVRDREDARRGHVRQGEIRREH